MSWLQAWAPVVGGYGTGGAFLIASIGYVYNRSKDLTARELEQARQFSAWVASVGHHSDNSRLFTLSLAFWNGNPNPISEVLVTPAYRSPHGLQWSEVRTIGQVPPSGNRPYRTDLQVELPGDVALVEGYTLDWTFFLADIGFMDTAGQWWRRDHLGHLEKISWDPPRRRRMPLSWCSKRQQPPIGSHR